MTTTHGRRRPGSIIGPITRAWLAAPTCPVEEVARRVRKCLDCPADRPTWVFGASWLEVDDRLAQHRRRRHG